MADKEEENIEEEEEEEGREVCYQASQTGSVPGGHAETSFANTMKLSSLQP